MDVGNKLKEIRLQYGINQLQFAEKLNIDASQYSKIERGVILPTLSQVMDIISMFKINSAWLLEDAGKMLKEKSFTEQFRNFFRYYKKGDMEYETKKEELYKALDAICNATGKTIEEISHEQYHRGYTIENNIKNDMLLSNMTTYLKKQYAFCFKRNDINYEAELEEKDKIINSQKDEIINLQRKLLEAKEISENK